MNKEEWETIPPSCQEFKTKPNPASKHPISINPDTKKNQPATLNFKKINSVGRVWPQVGG